MSNVFGTGAPQEAAMDPTLTNGQRKFITDLDVAFLQDIGWNVGTFSIIPEPASFTLFTGAALLLLSRRPKRR